MGHELSLESLITVHYVSMTDSLSSLTSKKSLTRIPLLKGLLGKYYSTYLGLKYLTINGLYSDWNNMTVISSQAVTFHCHSHVMSLTFKWTEVGKYHTLIKTLISTHQTPWALQVILPTTSSSFQYVCKISFLIKLGHRSDQSANIFYSPTVLFQYFTSEHCWQHLFQLFGIIERENNTLAWILFAGL